MYSVDHALPALVRSRGLLSALPPRSRRRVLVHLCGGSADYLWGRCRCHRPTSTTTTLPLLIHLPYPRPALIVSARLHLPIRTLLLRAGTAHALPVSTNVHCQDCVVERPNATISYPRLVSRPGRGDLGADAHARSAPRRAPPLPAAPGLPRARIQLRVLARKYVRSAGWERRDVARDVRNSSLCGRLAAPPIWDAVRAGAGGQVHIRCDVLVPGCIQLLVHRMIDSHGPGCTPGARSIGPRVGGRGEVGYAPALLLGPVFWSRSPRGSGDVDVPLLREDVVKGERGEGGSNGEQRVNPARVKAPALLHFGPVAIVDVCAFEGQRDRRHRRMDVDGGVLLLCAAPPAGVVRRCERVRERTRRVRTAGNGLLCQRAHGNTQLLAIPHSYLDGEETQTPMSLVASEPPPPYPDGWGCSKLNGTYSTPAHTSHLPSSTWVGSGSTPHAGSTRPHCAPVAPSSTLASGLTRRPRPRFTSPLRLGSKLNARFKAYSTPAPSFTSPLRLGSKLNARFKAYSTPAPSFHIPSSTWLQAQRSLQGLLDARALVPPPLCDPGPVLLPPPWRLIQIAAAPTKAACRRFVPRFHLLTWCGARRGQLEARTDAGGDIDEDEDVRHGVQDHIDIDAERCRGFGGGHEDGRRHAREYSVLTIDTRSPLSWILRERGGAGWPAQRSRSDIDMYAY
ncbi:hypothetical protein B0H14DRAFT_3889612 [Mycena olivaceomarginata]|nr:hypothetical protein B0H14DRAFT_3889612 [Mycena olivaceomarginata]